MPEQLLNTRIIHKHDIESNWAKATNFIPKCAEIIVYDRDDHVGGIYAYERFKIGDGKTPVDLLPFYLKHEIDGIVAVIQNISENALRAEYEEGILSIQKGLENPK